ncbi:MAG: hypothetical protein V1836_02730 [Candidatus Aenigmatarchaeota archaeon]
MSSYMSTVDIDLAEEISKRDREFGRLRIGAPFYRLDTAECRARVEELCPRIATNLGVEYEHDQFIKRIKVYSFANPKEVIVESLGKEDTLFPVMWASAIGYMEPKLLSDPFLAAIVALGATGAVLNAFAVSRFVAHSNMLTGDIKIPTTPVCKNKYEFDYVATHEITHGLLVPKSFGSRLKSVVKRSQSDKRKSEGTADASACLMMDILYEETDDVYYRREKVKEEHQRLTGAMRYSGMRRYFAKLSLIGSNLAHYEGFAKTVELQNKHGNSALQRIVQGEFDDQF